MPVSPIMKRFVEGEHYVKTTWGKSRKGASVISYECADCQFKTTEPDQMNEHLRVGDHSKLPYPKEDDYGLVLKGKHPEIAKGFPENQETQPAETPTE